MSRHTSTDEGMVSIGEAARLLGVSIDTLRRWDQEGRLPAVRTLGGQRRYPRARINELTGQTRKGRSA